MTNKFWAVAILFLSVQSFAGFDTVTQPIGTCKVADKDISANFVSESVTLDQQPYSKNMFVTFMDTNGASVPNPADSTNAERAFIPASEEVKIKEKKSVVQIIYNSSSLDNGTFALNTDSGNATLKRYIAFKGSIFSKKEVVQDFTLKLSDCAINVEVLTQAVAPQE